MGQAENLTQPKGQDGFPQLIRIPGTQRKGPVREKDEKSCLSLILGDKQDLGARNQFCPLKKKNCACEVEVSVELAPVCQGMAAVQRQFPGDVPYPRHWIPALTAMKSPCQLCWVGEMQNRPCKGGNFFRWLSRREQGSKVSPSFLLAFSWRWLVCAWQDPKALWWQQRWQV